MTPIVAPDIPATCLAKSPTGTINAQQIDIYLKQTESADATQGGTAAKSPKPALPGTEGPSRIDHMVAIGKVVVTEPNRRAVGDGSSIPLTTASIS